MQVLKSALFNLYVACNMLLCSVLFIGFSKPRETISGFLGRTFGNLAVSTTQYKGWKLYAMRALAYTLFGACTFIDWCFGERGHCGETAMAEDVMRQELYPVEVPAKPEQDANEAAEEHF